MIKYTKAGDKLTSSEAIKQTKDKFGITLGTGSYKQSDLTKLNFKLEEGITALNGLTSTMTLGSDCRWNDMSIGGSSSKPTNITVEGIGTDAEIFQWGLTWNYANSVAVFRATPKPEAIRRNSIRQEFGYTTVLLTKAKIIGIRPTTRIRAKATELPTLSQLQI